MALKEYNSIFDRLPNPTYFDTNNSAPLYSWRYRILPYYASYQRDCFFDLAWDHSKNAIWHGVPQPFAPNAWIDGVWDMRPPNKIPKITNVYAISGEDTAFGNGLQFPPQQLESLPNDLILVAEIRNSGHHWMKSGDFDVADLMKSRGSTGEHTISGVHDGGFHILFADLEVWFVSNEIPFENLSKFLTISDASQFERDSILGEYRIR